MGRRGQHHNWNETIQRGRPMETIMFSGIKYTRNPDSKQRAHRRYFFAARKSGGSTYHRDLWASIHGQPPKGSIVHHKDGDWNNNSPDNLVCVTRKEHAKIHAPERIDQLREMAAIGREYAKAWHASREGRAWHSENSRKQWGGKEPTIPKTCQSCGSEFMAHHERAKYCSRRCINREADKRRNSKLAVRGCPICGQPFKSRLRRKTCSRRCGAAYRRQKNARLQH